MQEEVERLVREYARGRQGVDLARFALGGTDCWTTDCTFAFSNGEAFRIRNVVLGDEVQLERFGRSLGEGRSMARSFA